MFEPECQMSIHERHESSHVLNQVSCGLELSVFVADRLGRQVQDLERQLHDARLQLDRVRALEQRNEPALDLGFDSPSQIISELPTAGKSPRRMLKARTPQDLGQARRNLSDYGRGLLKPPVVGVQSALIQRVVNLPPLPTRSAADQILQYYVECIHRQFPVLHWPSFHQNYLSVYERGLASMPRDWVGLLFAILACGSVCMREPRSLVQGQEFLDQALSVLDMCEDNITTNQAAVGFLASMFLTETNRKSAAWLWLGSAIRAAQDLGLHVQGGQWQVVEGEMRKRIWYSLYAWDR